jgi:hypothetical protein
MAEEEVPATAGTAAAEAEAPRQKQSVTISLDGVPLFEARTVMKFIQQATLPEDERAAKAIKRFRHRLQGAVQQRLGRSAPAAEG